MIAYLKGTIIHQSQNWLILNVNNIGYKIYTNNSYEKSSIVEFYIHHHIREEADDLYGFGSIEELTLFDQLLSVSGVGPKMALNLLNLNPAKLSGAIVQSDEAILTSIPGVGKKLAAKIVLELKSKLGSVDSLLPYDTSENTDLIAALEQLGYKQAEILSVVRDMPSSLSGTQAKLTWALQQMKKK